MYTYMGVGVIMRDSGRREGGSRLSLLGEAGVRRLMVCAGRCWDDAIVVDDDDDNDGYDGIDDDDR
jgi:hypothetical protein